MTLTQKVIDLVASYLTGEISIRDLRIAMARASIAADDADPRTKKLTYGVEHRLAEFTNGDWTEQELKDLLKPLVARYFIFIDATHPRKAARQVTPPQWSQIQKRSLAESA